MYRVKFFYNTFSDNNRAIVSSRHVCFACRQAKSSRFVRTQITRDLKTLWSLFKHPCFSPPQNVPRTDQMTRVIYNGIGPSGVQLIMVIELNGVQFGLKSYAWFQPKIARHEVQLPLYYIHFEIAQIQAWSVELFYWCGTKPVWN